MEQVKTVSLTADKYYFAAYLNMARHNAYIILTDINTRLLGGKPLQDDAKLITLALFNRLNTQSGTSTEMLDVQLKIIKELRKHFPFLHTMLYAYKKRKDQVQEDELQKMEYAPQDYYNFFKLFLKTLNSLRNYYTHAVPNKPVDFPQELLYGLNLTFDASVRKAKDRFGFKPADVSHLIRLVKKGDEVIEVPGFKYSFRDNSSIHRLVFFTCLLLEKKYAAQYTQRVEGLKDRRIPKYQSTFEVFTVNSIVLPKVRYSSDAVEGALMLDMFNELKRCPDELFPHLTTDVQNKFRIKPTDADELVADNIQLQDIDTFLVQKRYGSRFRYFAQRFIDEVNWFNRLRFPIDLGNYHYFRYPKTVDGVNRQGSLWEKLIGYGRLQDYQNDYVNNRLPIAWKELVNNYDKRTDVEDESPYIPPTIPHYHMDDEDNICLKIVEVDTEANTAEQKWLKWLSGGGGRYNKPPVKSKPDLLISKYELFGLLFYGLLLGKDNISTLEKKLCDYARNRKLLYSKLANGAIKGLPLGGSIPKPESDGKKTKEYDRRKTEVDAILSTHGFNFSCEDLPDELKCYLMGVTTESFEEKAKYLIDDFKEVTEYRLKAIKRQLSAKRKLGSKKDEEIKAGELAAFLAKDIMLFQPADTNNPKASGKATSTLYNVMQAKLALYGANVDTIERTFNECGLLSGNNPHPFLAEVVKHKCRTIVDFYIAYLEARKKYLVNCADEKNYISYQWLKNNQARKKKGDADYAKKLAKRMIDQPTVLPRGFFTPLVEEQLLQLKNDTLTKVITQTPRRNISFLLQAYWRYVKIDDVQEFYANDRVYKIFNNYYDPHPVKGTATKQKPTTEQERISVFKELKKWAIVETEKSKKEAKRKENKSSVDYNRRFDDFELTEKLIRQTKAEDMVLFMAANYLMKYANVNLFSTNTNFYLKDIQPQGDKGILSMPLERFYRSFEYTYTDADGHSKTGTTIIYQLQLKVKNIGDFNKFSRDRRLPNLLGILRTDEISRDILEKELLDYDRVRLEVFRVLHDFEKSVISNNTISNTEDFEIILTAYKNQSGISDIVYEQIKNIRNKFSHNQYPPIDLFHDLFANIPQSNIQSLNYASRFLEFLKLKLNIQ